MIECIFLQLFLLGLAVFPFEKKENNTMLSVENTNVIRMVCSIIVVYAHLNMPIQFVEIGYFHFVAVSLFFLFSGYGLSYSEKNKVGYLNGFWKRILKIAIPYLVIIVLKVVLKCEMSRGGIFYVNVLILFYLAFFFSHKYCPKYKDLILVLFVIAYSIFAQYFHDGTPDKTSIFIYMGWGSQSIAFLYGIFLSKHYDKIVEVIENKKIFLIISNAFIVIVAGVLLFLDTNSIVISWKGFVLRICISFSMIFLLFLFTCHLKFSSVIGGKMGNVSYKIFLIHGLVIEVIERKVSYEQIGAFLYIVLILSVVLICSIIWEWIEKIIRKKLNIRR